MIPGLGRFAWRREWQPTPLFLPGEFHGQRSLAGCSPRGQKQLDMTERLTLFVECVDLRTGSFLLAQSEQKARRTEQEDGYYG